MAFALPLSLAEARRSVAVRLNFGPQADASPDMRALLDEFIRRAARELLLEADWVELDVELAFMTTPAQHVYDWPDNMDLGRVEAIFVVDSEGREHTLEAGLRDYERNQWDSKGEVDRAGLPLRYEVVNEELRIYPAPSDQYPELHFRGYLTPRPPLKNEDRIPVDHEALLQKATAIGKKHFGMPDAMQADMDVALYLNRLRPTESDGSGFRIGGHFSQKFHQTSKRTGFRRDRRWGQNGWWDGWTPAP